MTAEPTQPAVETSIVLGSAAFTLRRASVQDVPAIVELIAADQLGATRDGGPGADLAPYLRAFEAITADPAQLLIVVVSADGAVVGTLQLTFIPGMARRGALRAQIEAVRVGEAQRGLGLGREMMLWAIEESRRRGCALVQLTTDKQREAAHRFYARLGFAASHEGMKLALVSAGQQTTDLGVPLLPLDDIAGLLDTLEGDGRRS